MYAFYFMAVRVNVGIIEADLVKLAALIKEMISINIDASIKQYIKNIVDEIKSLYGDLVDSYVGFKALRKNDNTFEEKFSPLFENFERTYLKSADDKAGACARIHSALYDIIQSRWYLSKLPILHKRIENFKNLADEWLNDTAIVQTFKEFNTQIYQELSAIEESYGREPTTDSRRKLKQFVSRWDTEFQSVRNKLNDFTSITDSIS
jgi:hypothetical protein